MRDCSFERRRGSAPQYRRLLWVWLLVFGSAACRQAPPQLEAATQNIAPEGGVIVLPGGVSATFAPGFLVSETAVTLGRSDAPVDYPAAVADAYRGAEAVADAVTLTLPAAALGVGSGVAEQPTVALRVPAGVPRLEGEERLLAEVHLYLADGQHLFFFEPYARVEGDTGQTFEGTDTVTIRAGQLRSDGAASAAQVRVTVRPVRLGTAQLAPQALPTGFAFETVASGLGGGVAFDFAPDGRIFIAEKSGVIKVSQNGRVSRFADLSKQVNNTHDRGLLGLAVHPQFPQQPYVYALFTYDPPEVQRGSGYGGPDNLGARVARLVRLSADAAQGHNAALAGSEVVLLGKNSTYANIGAPTARNGAKPSCGPVGTYVQDCLPADEWSHTVGALRFAPDGSLFVSNGDGASYGGVQDYTVRSLELDSLAGKVLRIDPLTGRGYANNPFYNGNTASNRAKVYSYGLRNPFRFALQPQTGALFVGDVGWNTWEEVNSGRGKNFGWPCYEGGNGSSLQQGGYRSLARCAALYTNAGVSAAVYAYSHGSGGSSVQLGDFYSGTRYPAPYRGALFISDINQGRVRYLTLNGAGAVTSAKDFGTAAGISQISAGPSGDLYFMNLYAGTLQRLRYTAPDTVALVAKLSATPPQGTAPLAVAFSSAGSSGVGTLRYAWNFGDGATSAAANPGHTFTQAGVYRVALTVSDTSGETVSDSLVVRVDNTPPVATILSPPSGLFTVGDTVVFRGRGTDAEQGTLPGSALRWTLKMHHNAHTHPDGLPPTTGANGNFVTEDHGDHTYLELCLTATDAFDESGSSCATLRPNTVAYALDTVPTGLELPWEGTLRRTPFSVTTNVNGVQQLLAPAQQGGYTFSSWSDGGARDHTVRIGASPARLVATYTGSGNPPAGKLAITAQCRNVWLVRNPLATSVPYSWKILSSGRRGSRTAPPGSRYELWLPSYSSRVTFYQNGAFYSTLSPNTQGC